MSALQGGRGPAGYARPSSASAARPTAQQQWLAQRASSSMDYHVPIQDVPSASLRNSTSFANASQQGSRRSAEFSSQPPHSYSPGPAHLQRATLSQLSGFSQGSAHPQSNARATSPTLQQQQQQHPSRPAPATPQQQHQQQQHPSRPAPGTPQQQQQQQRQPPSSSNFGNIQQLTAADGRSYHMNVATGKGSWAPQSHNSMSAPAPAPSSSSAPISGQQRTQAAAPSKAAAASGEHPLLQPLLSAQHSNERTSHARSLAATLRDDAAARISLCNPDALAKLLRMLQFEVPADEAFFLLMCLTNILIEQSAQICCVSISFCIPMLVQRAAKWSQISNQHHPNICFAALANLCLQDDGCSVCSRAGVFRCLSSSLNAAQDAASLHYCMRLLSALLGHAQCSHTILTHNDILPGFFNSALHNGALQDAQVAESASIVLHAIFQACRCHLRSSSCACHTSSLFTQLQPRYRHFSGARRRALSYRSPCRRQPAATTRFP